jgi:hypothetical protein
LRHVVLIAVVLELLAWPILKLLPKIADDVDPRPITFSFLLAAFYLGNAGVSLVIRPWWTAQVILHPSDPRHRDFERGVCPRRDHDGASSR